MSLSREQIHALAHSIAAGALANVDVVEYMPGVDWKDTKEVRDEILRIAQQHMQQARISKLLGQGKGSIQWG